MYSLSGLPNHNFGAPLYYNLVDYNVNLGNFLTLHVYFLFLH